MPDAQSAEEPDGGKGRLGLAVRRARSVMGQTGRRFSGSQVPSGVGSGMMGRSSSASMMAMLLLAGAICLLVGVQVYSSLHHTAADALGRGEFGKQEGA